MSRVFREISGAMVEPTQTVPPTHSGPVIGDTVLIPSAFTSPFGDNEKWDRRHEEDLRMRCIEAAVERINVSGGFSAVALAQEFYAWVKKVEDDGALA